jgi:single-strand DNA-binding protein
MSNNVYHYGHFAADPELKYTNSGKALCSFRIGVNTGFGEKKTTEWINCVAWEKLGEKVAEQGAKGKEIAVFGRSQTKEWTGRDGNKRKDTEVTCHIAVVGAGTGGSGERRSAAPVPRVEPELQLDDIPF